MSERSRRPSRVSRGRPARIVGVAASAGGLDAFAKFLGPLPPDTGMAFVLFQHLDPRHESLLAALLSKATRLPVSEVLDGDKVSPDRVYIVPPNRGMLIKKGVLRLVARSDRAKPIDSFFESLACDQNERAIGVVLSGEASDGTRGLEAIKARGGVAFAQTEASAAHVGMPRSAAASGCVDYVLPPEEIAKKLARMSREGFSPASAKALERNEEFFRILGLVQRGKGVDFSDYKPGTINRRIERRMAALGIPTLSRYEKELRRNPSELDALAHDFLIHVTSFFRDPRVFKALRSKVYPALVKRRSADNPIRIWVTACSTGEEAYSHCINLLEFLGRGADRPPIQIFATDISEEAVQKARAGIYPKKSVLGLPSELLNKYFVKVAQGYQIIKPVRDLCVFAQQNVAADTPFSKLDLVSCRNVLIYLGPVLQKKVLGIFHYALKPEGVLVLGGAESVDAAADLFAAIDGKRRIYSNKAFKGMEFISSPATRGARKSAPERPPIEHRRSPAVPETPPLDLAREIDRLLLKRFAPATLVVDDELFILQFRGPISRYLAPLSGKASLNLSRMALEGLRLELIAAVDAAKKTGDAVRKEGLDVERDGRPAKVDVDVIPVKGATPTGRCWAIVFSDSPLPVAADSGKAVRASESRRVLKLKRELVESHEALQSLMERHDISNQELASTQEESLAHNEELRSLNEELETAKEELQSTNEELTTINDELIMRNHELVLAGEFSEAVVDTVRESLLVLEEDLMVKSANRSFYETFKLSRTEVENHFLYSLAGGLWDIPKLREILESTLRASKIREDIEVDHEIPGLGRRLLRFTARRVYRDDAGARRRVLLAIEDITVRRELEELDALRKRDAMRREFVAHVSHQFRTPLTAIRGFAETLRKGGLKNEESQKEFLDTIERHAVRLSRLVDDLLSLSIIESAPTGIHSEKIDLSLFVGKFVKGIEPLLSARRLSLKFRIPKGLEVRADETLLRQVLQSLCENAIKYSHPGGRVDIEARPRNGHVLVSIRDRGIGIPLKERIRIFEPFHRTRGGRTLDPTGTGLGLSIAQKIVESFGGKIWAENNDGKGSKLSFTLPIAPPRRGSRPK